MNDFIETAEQIENSIGVDGVDKLKNVTKRKIHTITKEDLKEIAKNFAKYSERCESEDK